MYPENPEGSQVIVGSMNMGYISDTARNRTHNLFRPKRGPLPLGHSDGLVSAYLYDVAPVSFLHACTTYYPSLLSTCMRDIHPLSVFCMRARRITPSLLSTCMHVTTYTPSLFSTCMHDVSSVRFYGIKSLHKSPR